MKEDDIVILLYEKLFMFFYTECNEKSGGLDNLRTDVNMLSNYRMEGK